MLIANPIYDSVFKYLLDDARVARIVISTLIDREVVELELKPTETALPKDDMPVKYTVLRMDFAAKIRTPEGGLYSVLVELQKAKLPHDIIRFRRYLASAYRNASHIERRETAAGARSVAIPIVAVYILGHKLEGIDVPTLRIERNYVDAATGQTIKARDEFAEGITHDAVIVQLPCLKDRRRSALEKMLALFDPSAADPEQPHFLNIKAEDVSERYREVFHRLLMAAQSPDIQTLMEAEDEYLETLADYERTVAERNRTLLEKDQALAEQKQALMTKDNALAEQSQELAEKDRLLDEQRKASRRAIQALLAAGKSLEEIRSLGLDPDK